MSADFTVRVVVHSSVFKISVDRTLPISWLIRETMRRYRDENGNKDPHITGLFNRSKMKEIALVDDIGRSMSSHDVIEATCHNSHRYSNDTKKNLDSIRYSNHSGLFFDQLRLFQYLGNHLPPVRENNATQKSIHLRNLLSIYIGIPSDSLSKNSKEHSVTSVQKPSNKLKKVRPPIPNDSLVTPKEEPELRMEADTDFTYKPTKIVNSNHYTSNSKKSGISGFSSVFDIVFSQQAIGLKLGTDVSKNYAVVKECFEGSEASRYVEIQSGVAIIAVNGEVVAGIGLSRTLYKLREAKRPVIVRFGTFEAEKTSSVVLNPITCVPG